MGSHPGWVGMPFPLGTDGSTSHRCGDEPQDPDQFVVGLDIHQTSDVIRSSAGHLLRTSVA
jgi:hypothetical protein